MSRYALAFSKFGYMKYTSHLDMIRLFKRLFKRQDIRLEYSKGFNPHPKMAFAQPLSLGYSALNEWLEFETIEEIEPEEITRKLGEACPEGLRIQACLRLPDKGKTLAALTIKALYEITWPMDNLKVEVDSFISDFLEQNEIFVKKAKKGSKELIDIEIRSKIHVLKAKKVDDNLIMTTTLDAGSDSNLSPELLIQAIGRYANLVPDRENIEIQRQELIFNQGTFKS